MPRPAKDNTAAVTLSEQAPVAKKATSRATKKAAPAVEAVPEPEPAPLVKATAGRKKKAAVAPAEAAPPAAAAAPVSGGGRKKKAAAAVPAAAEVAAETAEEVVKAPRRSTKKQDADFLNEENPHFVFVFRVANSSKSEVAQMIVGTTNNIPAARAYFNNAHCKSVIKQGKYIKCPEGMAKATCDELRALGEVKNKQKPYWVQLEKKKVDEFRDNVSQREGFSLVDETNGRWKPPVEKKTRTRKSASSSPAEAAEATEDVDATD